MYTHIVFWKLSGQGATADTQAETILQALRAMPGKVEGLDSLQCGRNVSDSEASWDIYLISTHADEQAYVRYQDDTEHAAVKAIIGPLVRDRAVVDAQS